MQTKITQRLTALFLLVQVCSFFSFFTSCTKDLEDLGIPKKATLVFPANGADNIELFPTLRWSVPSEGSVLTTYEVYLGNTPNPSTKVGSITGDTSWLVTDALTSSTTYYWKVISRAGEKSDSSSIFSFTTTATTSVAVNSLTLGKTSSTLDVGKKDTAKVTIAPDNATNKNFSVASNNPNVATAVKHNDSIIITAVAEGNTTITVTSEADASKSATFAVTVNAPVQTIAVTGITLNKTTTSIAINGTETITPTIAPENATNKNVTWTSANEAVATVNPNGVITVVASGTTTITATTQDGAKTASITVLALTSLDGSTSYRFANDGHTYYIVNQTKNWEDAMGIATGVGGHLVHINSAAEQSVIQSKINTSGFNFTVTVDDGGGARYLWIGASDKNAEGTWQWMTSTTAGTTFGTANASYNSTFMEWQLNSYSPTSSAFQNWGTSTSGNQQKEPDNYDKSQNVAAIALEGWPTWQPGFYGRAFQWNDLAETNMLPFIVEIDR